MTESLAQRLAGILLTPNEVAGLIECWLPVRDYDPKETPVTPTNENPEQRVLDEIDQLVERSLIERHQDNYNAPYKERCELCFGSWHGLTGNLDNNAQWGCPGAFGTEQQKTAWREGYLPSSPPPDDEDDDYMRAATYCGAGGYNVEPIDAGDLADEDVAAFSPPDGFGRISWDQQHVFPTEVRWTFQSGQWVNTTTTNFTLYDADTGENLIPPTPLDHDESGYLIYVPYVGVEE